MRLAQYTSTKKALGGPVTLGFVSGDNHEVADHLMQQLWLAVFTFEKRFSRFITTSELSIFNHRAGSKVSISPEFEQLLRAAERQARQTEGLYNPFILPALHQAGYIRTADADYAADEVIDYTKRTVADVTQLEIGDGFARIPYATAIDLGGCGKGYLADQLGTMLREAGVAGYWLELSGDIAVFGHDTEGNPVSVAVQSATGEPLPEPIVCPVTPSGVATSGTFRRASQTESLRSHHIIDPGTLLPAETDIALATVQADTALDADVLASCAVIVGSQAAPTYLREHGARGWILQALDKNGAYTTMIEGMHA